MLPTQFFPEYYRDAKDILWADDVTENEQSNPRKRRSLFTRIRNLLRRPARTPEGECTEQPERVRPAH